MSVRTSVVVGAILASSMVLAAMTGPPHDVPRAAPLSPPAARLSVPIVLVPGWFDTGRDLAALRIRLLGAGLDGEAVHTITFEDPTGSNMDHADEIHVAVSELLARTGAERVDIVAHSMGGLATRWYLNTHPNPPVRRVAFLGTPHRGTLSAHLAWGAGRDEMLPDSPFLEALNTQAPLPEGIEAITVRTLLDTHVIPGENGTLPGIEDHVVCCPTHPGLLEDEEVFLVVLDFLERVGAGTLAAPSR